MYGTNCCSVFKVTFAGAFSVLHVFDPEEGFFPAAPLFLDEATGDLYGTADGGRHDCGVVFRLAADGTYKVLHSFAGWDKDGCEPQASSVIMDPGGNLYGTTVGGTGGVYKLAPDGTATVLHRFTGGLPAGGVVRDGLGNLYGTTTYGGAHGYGVLFKIAPDGAYTVLHDFARGADGAEPTGELLLSRSGRIFGITNLGGAEDKGVAYCLNPTGVVKVLVSFPGYMDYPRGSLIEDKDGNLYGTTADFWLRTSATVFELVR
jgi:uncharacterized repeat protein (TIGR03803 family)